MEGWGWQSIHDPVKLPEVLERWRAAIATGAALPQQVAQFRAADMDDHVGKPFKREELYAAIARRSHAPE